MQRMEKTDEKENRNVYGSAFPFAFVVFRISS